jgi:hypothetical protein
MGEPTDDNGWGLPSATFWRSLCPPPLPPPWPPQRPDLIPPWQDPAERHRVAQAAAEAERVRAEEEETLQFIRDYVQALRDWRKEIVFHWGDHVIGRTTISLFKNPPAGEPAQPSPVQPAAAHVGTLAADLDRSSPHELDISSAAASTTRPIGANQGVGNVAGPIERPPHAAAPVGSRGANLDSGPDIAGNSSSLPGTNTGEGEAGDRPA